MLKSLKVLFFLCLLTLVFSNSAFAASGKFLSQANKYYNTICKLPLVTMNLALDCYVFDKVGEMATVISDMQLKVGDLISSNNTQNTRISTLEEENASQQEEIQTLKNKIAELEESTPTIITLANNLSTSGPNGPAIQIPNGFKSMTIENTLSGALNGWSPQVSFDGGTTWYEQHRFGCGSNCQVITIPILGPLYRFSPGGGSGTVTSKATLNKEPNSKVIVFGHGLNYPFLSDVIDATGYSKILVTAGGGDNPQNLQRISLQAPESGGTYGQADSVICDGGATCPLQFMLLQSGQNLYKIGIVGNGTNGLFGALLRP